MSILELCHFFVNQYFRISSQYSDTRQPPTISPCFQAPHVDSDYSIRVAPVAAGLASYIMRNIVIQYS